MEDQVGSNPQLGLHEAEQALDKKQSKQAGLKAQHELKQFLKVVRPEWGYARSGGGNRLQQVVDKLHTIGIFDKETFVSRVLSGAINDDLFAIGKSRFSQKTLEAVKKHKPLVLALENASKGPYV